jgi:hypothetical protein
MKKTLTIITLLAGAVAGYSQGEINFLGNITGFKQVIYSANPGGTGNNVTVTYNGYTVSEEQGSTAAAPESPTGNTVYGGTLLTGTAYDATLLGAPGSGDTLSQLQPLLTTSSTYAILNFYTGGTPSGTLMGSIPVVTGASGGPETIAIAAWQATGAAGAANTLAAAQADGYAWGISALANITSISAPSTPAAMTTASNLNLSFSLGSVPEPSTIALGVIGASTLLFRRRK